jgi:glycosyltransferase involved in cell wall biosynthesis
MAEKKRVGFVSTRIAGTDGVSLETYKWFQVLERNGYKCYAFAGELDTPAERSFLEPKAHFNHPEVLEINRQCFGRSKRSPHISKQVQALKNHLKDKLYEFCREFGIDVLIPENVLAIPMHIPLGVALTQFLAETGMPAVAHHHDFSWERDRFLVNGVQDYLQYAFPPALTTMRHVVINSAAARQLSFRRGISNTVIPNVFDFKTMPPEAPNGKVLRSELGFEPDDLFVLQPTRIVPRKWIERAVELVSLLGERKPRLVISHEWGDEGDGYVERVREFAQGRGVELVLIGDIIGPIRSF